MKPHQLLLLIVFLGFQAQLVVAQQSHSNTPSAALYFALASPQTGVFIAGDEVKMAVYPIDQARLNTDTFTLAVDLPEGLILADKFWSLRENTAIRKLAVRTEAADFPVALTTRIAPGFKGNVLTAAASLSGYPSQKKSLTISVGTLLSSETDTCLYVQDTTLTNVNTYLATRQRITARLPGPINLSPIGPLRISHGNCQAFHFKPGKKRDRQKEQCTALHFAFVGQEAEDYPRRFAPGPEKLKGITEIRSNSNLGDTVNISVKTLDGKPLRGLLLTDARGELLVAEMDAAGITYETVLDTATLNLTLHLRARRHLLGLIPVKQYCLVNVQRRPTAVTMLRGPDTSMPPPGGESTLLSREISSIAAGDTSWLKTTAWHSNHGTVVFRILEHPPRSGASPDTLSRDTCSGIFDLRVSERSTAREVWVPADTLLFQASDEEVTIVGQRNPLGIRQGSMEIKVPIHLDLDAPQTRDSLIGLAWWIGIGEPTLEAYETLAGEIPPEWGQPGASPPLAAYGSGHPIVLPGLSPGEADFQRQIVRYEFVTSQNRTAFTSGSSIPLIRRDPKRPNYGMLSGAVLATLQKTAVYDQETGKKVLRFYLAYRNMHDINTYRLQLKVVAYYQVRIPGVIWEKASP